MLVLCDCRQVKVSTLYPRSHPRILISSTTVSFHLPKEETKGEVEEKKWEKKEKRVKVTRRLLSHHWHLQVGEAEGGEGGTPVVVEVPELDEVVPVLLPLPLENPKKVAKSICPQPRNVSYAVRLVIMPTLRFLFVLSLVDMTLMTRPMYSLRAMQLWVSFFICRITTSRYNLVLLHCSIQHLRAL